MNCLHHPNNRITFICKATHKCQMQRKLCVECQKEHEVEVGFKNIVPIKEFQQMILQKVEQYQLEEKLEKHKKNFKSLFSNAEIMLKKIFKELLESIEKIYDIIQHENNSFINLKNKEIDLAESSFAYLEKLVQIMEGKVLDDQIISKDSILFNLENQQKQFDEEIRTFGQKLKDETLQNIQFIQKQKNQQSKIQNNDILGVFASLNNIDEQLLENIITLLRQQKSSDCIEFLLNHCTQQYVGKFLGFKANLSFKENQIQLDYVNQGIQLIINALKNIQETEFNTMNYSLLKFQEIRTTLITLISQNNKLVQFLKFLVNITAIDSRYIQCGSNSLNLLVELKVDLKGQSFENIRIKDTQLIGGNFARCNLSRSQFDNVDISGINLNGALLENCNFKNLRINELNSFYGRSVTSVCFSPNATILAFGSRDNTVRFLDVKTGKQKGKILGHLICFSPNGTTFAIIYKNNIHLYVNLNRLKNKLSGYSSGIASVCFSRDGTLLAYSQYDCIRLWDVKRGLQKRILDDLRTVNSVCFSPDGTILASGSQNYIVQLWDVETGQKREQMVLHNTAVLSVCFSPDGKRLVSSSDDDFIRIWDIKSGQQTKLNGLQPCFSPDSTTLASGSSDNCIRIWDVETGQQIGILEGHSSAVRFVCYSTDGTVLASCSDESIIRLWDLNMKQQHVNSDFHSSVVHSVCFSPDGTILASGSQDKTVRLWDVNTGQQLRKLQEPNSAVFSVCFSPVDMILASGHQDSSIYLWDVKTGQQKGRLNGHNKFVRSVCFSPDGVTLASGSYDHSIRLWNVKTRQQQSILEGQNLVTSSICFSPDSTILAYIQDKSVQLCDVNTNQQLRKLQEPNSAVFSVCFSPVDMILAAGHQDSSIYLWDVKTGQQKGRLNGHIKAVILVCFSPDGVTLASSSYDHFIRLWNVKTRQQQSILEGHSSLVRSVSFSPDGTKLASGSQDKSIRLWDIKIDWEIKASNQRDQEIINKHNKLNKNIANSKNTVVRNITIQLISQNLLFQASGAKIFQGEFQTYKGVNLLQLFKFKGSVVKKSLLNKKVKQ